MKTVKQIEQEIEQISEERKKAYREYEKLKDKLNQRVGELEEQKQRAFERFEDKIRKLFGVIDVCIKHDKYGIEIKICENLKENNFRDTYLFIYRANFMDWQKIGIENAENIKASYEEIYGYPQKNDLPFPETCNENETGWLNYR